MLGTKHKGGSNVASPIPDSLPEAHRKADRTFVRMWWVTMAVIGVGVMALAWIGKWKATMVQDAFVLKHAIDLVGVLFFVTLLQERALEVLVSTVRGTKARARELHIEKLEKDIAEERDGPDNLRQLTEKLHDEKVLRNEYRSGTIKFAFSASMVLGILISAVGIRVLAQMFQVDVLSDAQQPWFAFTDILITGALIAGGSEGIHKIMNVLSNFLERQAKIAKKKPS